MNISLHAIFRSIGSIYFFISVAAIALLVVSCAAHKGQHTAPLIIPSDGRAEKYTSAHEIETRILEEYRQWQGTRHRLGGTGSKGIDCSGFVREVYRDVFNIDLPRTTKEQVKRGKSVAFSELQPGDLVFFKPPTYPRHVGIFLSKSEFVHASKNNGVTVSKIDANYWGKYFWTARRILPTPENQ